MLALTHAKCGDAAICIEPGLSLYGAKYATTVRIKQMKSVGVPGTCIKPGLSLRWGQIWHDRADKTDEIWRRGWDSQHNKLPNFKNGLELGVTRCCFYC